jgi:hypothetical protein
MSIQHQATAAITTRSRETANHAHSSGCRFVPGDLEPNRVQEVSDVCGDLGLTWGTRYEHWVDGVDPHQIPTRLHEEILVER